VSSNGSLLSLLRALWSHLSPRRRKQFALLQLLMVISVVAEVVSIGAVVPFIGILAAPEAAFSHPLVAAFARHIGVTTSAGLVYPLTVCFAVVALLAGVVRLVFSWASTRLTFASGADLSEAVYLRTLYQGYDVHIQRSSSEVISGIATKVGTTMLGVLLPGITLVSSVFLLLGVMATLIVIDPFVALISAVGFGATYGIVTWITDGGLRRNSRVISREQNQVVKALQEGLGGIRDVLLDNTQAFYGALYTRADRILRRAQGTNVFIAQCPRPMVEAFGMVMIAALAYGLARRPGGIAEGLPALAALALGAQRLLPALQSTYSSWTTIVGYQGVLEDTIKLLDQPLPAWSSLPPPAPLPFREAIRFSNVRFRYTPEGPWALDGIDLRIPLGARVGFVGGTGGGKSTTMDMLMGLLRPTEGSITVDEHVLDAEVTRAWQRNIAHVPQTIYLADASLAENIAFGLPRERIDMDRVREAARRAQIDMHISSREHGYDEVVGERGIRLSGGQRQRIGIARALYKQASVLVLDEATSALDNVTEKSVMEAIGSLDRALTILVIAHRLTTVQRCDFIVQIESGRVVGQGTYEQLLETSQSFRQMARAASHA
jgi:ABC-type multidrug transport system fused ATPase/permease subunit